MGDIPRRTLLGGILAGIFGSTTQQRRRPRRWWRRYSNGPYSSGTYGQ